MSTPRVIAYLTVKVLLNSIRRAFGNPVRAILTIAVLGFFICGWGVGLVGSFLGDVRPRSGTLMFDPSTLLTRSVGLVVLIHWFYVLSVILPAFIRPSFHLFRESDVDFLFTTPMRPLALFRGILWTRGLLTAFLLLIVLVFYLIVFGGRNLRTLVMGAEPAVGTWAILVYPTMYLLVFATALVGGMSVALLEMLGSRLKRYLVGAVVVWAVACVGLVGGTFYQRLQAGERFLEALGASVEWLPATILLLPVRGLADSALVLYQGWTPAILINLALWGMLLLMADRVLVRHQDRLYELASQLARTAGQARMAQTNPVQAYYERMVERAEKRPVHIPRLLDRWQARGVWALLWRDLLLMWRSNGWVSLLLFWGLALLPVVLAGFMAFTSSRPESVPTVARVVYMMVHGFVMFIYSFGSYYAFAHMLGRADWQKPLPFSPNAVVVVESLTLVVVYSVGMLLSFLAMCVLFPNDWLFWLAGTLALISWMVTLQMAMFMLALINPDPSDYTQRLVAGVLILPIMGVAGVPGAVLWGLGMALELPILLVGLMVVILNTVLSMIAVAINGVLYERFSPVD